MLLLSLILTHILNNVVKVPNYVDKTKCASFKMLAQHAHAIERESNHFIRGLYYNFSPVGNKHVTSCYKLRQLMTYVNFYSLVLF